MMLTTQEMVIAARLAHIYFTRHTMDRESARQWAELDTEYLMDDLAEAGFRIRVADNAEQERDAERLAALAALAADI